MLALGPLGWVGVGLVVMGLVLWLLSSRVIGVLFRVAAIVGFALVGYSFLIA